jgi:uncharacterized protein (UPF0264 family)
MATRLLVSVRNAGEAEAALGGGADLIDVKEPSRGPLGRADAETIAAIVRAVNGRAPVSAAMGELRNWSPADGLPPDVRYVKWGLCGLAHERWRQRLSAARELAGRRLVVVAYADHAAADAPSSAEVIAFALEARLSPVLIDTFRKNGATLFEVLSVGEITDLVRTCHESGLRIALAGSLSASTIARHRNLRPDWFAVRSAACDGGRHGVVSECRVRELGELVRQSDNGLRIRRRTATS